MPMDITLQTSAHGEVLNEIMAGLVCTQGRITLSAGTKLTDNSGGAAVTTALSAAPRLTDAARSGTTGAPKTATETAFGSAEVALRALATEMKTIHESLGLPTITVSYSATGTASKTIPAITKAVTGAAHGTPAAGPNNALRRMEQDMFVLCAMTNRVADILRNRDAFISYNLPYVDSWWGEYTFSDIQLVFGTDHTTGSGRFDFALTMTGVANNIATIASKINALRDVPTPEVRYFQ